MAHSFNPNPIVAAARIFLLAVILSTAAFVFEEYIERIVQLLVLLVWLAAAIYIASLYASAKFQLVTLDERSIEHRIGVLSQRRVVLPYAKITEATYTQSLFQRLFGVGTLHLDSAGGATVAIHVANINKSDIDLIMKEVNEKSGKGDGV